MANGDITFGFQSAGIIQTSLGDIGICTWTMPENTTARVEAMCIVQKTTDTSVKNSFRLTATVVRATGSASISDGPTKRYEEGSGGIDVTISANGSDITVATTSPDGDTYRVSAFMDIYSVEQAVIII